MIIVSGIVLGMIFCIQLRILEGRVLFFWKGKRSEIRRSSCANNEINIERNQAKTATSSRASLNYKKRIPEMQGEVWEKETMSQSALLLFANEHVRIYQTENQK